MKILVSYHFEIQHRPGKKMAYVDYLSRLHQGQTEYLWGRKDIKFVLNVLYTKEGIYGSKRYKNPMKGLIQVSCEKVDKGETSYQAVCKKIREEMDVIQHQNTSSQIIGSIVIYIPQIL